MEEWTRAHIIGHGATAAVWEASSRKSGEIIALKSAELRRSEPLQREAEILATLDCPYIIGYRGSDVSVESGSRMFNLKLEYAAGGNLAGAARRRGGLDGQTVRRYTWRILKGLEYLHCKGIVHCDVKGSNVLICEKGVKIADFGCAKAAADTAAIGGTPMYMAPEVARGEEQGFAADIWALGCTVIEMAAGKPPWPDAAAATVRRIAFSGEVPEFPACLSELGKDFLSKCLRVCPEERWTAAELLRHPFVDGLESPAESRTESPTSVLDRGVWGRVEEESLQDSEDSSECPKQRMQELWGKSEKGNWEWEESWITVRKQSFVNSDERWTEELLDDFQFL